MAVRSIGRLAAGGLIALLGLARPVDAAAPVPATGRFVSHVYALTFLAPPHLTYCPVPSDWTGSDHGTILFLVPPRICDGVGYPSISRGFEPARTPRIEIEYERWDQDEPPPRNACRRAGHITLLGRTRALCRSRVDGLIALSTSGLYVADDDTQAIVTLLTSRARLRRDLPVLRRLAATIRTCSVPWQDSDGHTHVTGSGRPCPDQGGFY